MARAAIFVDGAYLDNVLREEFPALKIDHARLSEILVGDRVELLRTYYYHCLPYQSNPPTEEERRRISQMQRFFRALRRSRRFEVREGQLAYRGQDAAGKPIFIQKRVDLMLGVDLALLAGKRLITDAFLVAGDSDLIPAIVAAKNEGIVVRLVHGKSVHDDLLDAVDERIRITGDLLGRCLRAELPPS